MRWISNFFILIALFAGTTSVAAEPFRREVSFEWNEIPDAKTYDVEIRRVTTDGPGKPMSYKTTQAMWMGKLIPGKYTMSLRSRDVRGVPGEWSPNSEFDVGLDPVALKSPPDKAEIKANDDLLISQKLEWSPVGGAKEYRFELSSEDGKTQIVENITGTSYIAKIPVAQTYTMKVTGVGDNGMQSETPAVSTFSVLGKKLSPPKITAPETEFVREIRWTKPDHVEKFDLTLNHLNPSTKKWEKVLTEENVEDNVFNFDSNHPGGVYSLQVKAHGKMRGNSDIAKVNFKVVGGNRSPAAEYTALVRKSIDRVTGWYAIASYLVTQINYRGETPETGGLTTTNALGGTGRLGAGYFTKDDRWGFIGIVDMSGFSISGSNHTYSSVELSGISRYVTSDRSESRLIAGLYYKELPQLIGTPSSSGPPVVDFIQSAVAGPHVGGEYWYSLNPKVGFQANAHLYYPLMTVKSPNGNQVEPRVSYQLGLMGSYRFNTHFTGLLGLTQRYDEVAYKANKTGSTFQSSGEYDVTQISGSYLSMFAEYGF